MAYGLETIDANGTKVVRVTDRLTRFVQANTVTFSANNYGQLIDVAVSGMVDDGTWVAWSDSIYVSTYIYTGFVRLRAGISFSSDININVIVLRV